MDERLRNLFDVWKLKMTNEKIKWIEGHGIEKKRARDIDLIIKAFVSQKGYCEDEDAIGSIAFYIRTILENEIPSCTNGEEQELKEHAEEYLKNKRLIIFQVDYIGFLVYLETVFNLLSDVFLDGFIGFLLNSCIGNFLIGLMESDSNLNDIVSSFVEMSGYFVVLALWSFTVNHFYKREKCRDYISQLNVDATISIMVTAMIYYFVKFLMVGHGAKVVCIMAVGIVIIVLGTIFPVYTAWVRMKRYKHVDLDQKYGQTLEFTAVSLETGQIYRYRGRFYKMNLNN